MIKPDKIFCGMLEVNYNILTTNIDLILFLPLKSLNKLKSYIKQIENATFGRIQKELNYYEDLVNGYLDLLDMKWENATEDMCYSAWRCFKVRDYCYNKSYFGDKSFPDFENNFTLFETEVCGGKFLDALHDVVDKGFQSATDAIGEFQDGFNETINNTINDMTNKYIALLENTYINLTDLSLSVYLSTDDYITLENKLTNDRNNKKASMQANQTNYVNDYYNPLFGGWNETITENTTEISTLETELSNTNNSITTTQSEIDAKQTEINNETDPDTLAILKGEMTILKSQLASLEATKSSLESDISYLQEENETLEANKTDYDTYPPKVPSDDDIQTVYNDQKDSDDLELEENAPKEGEMNVYDLLEEIDKYAQCAIGSCDFAYSAKNFSTDTSLKMSTDTSRQVDTTDLTTSMNEKWNSLNRQMSKITTKIDNAYLPKTVKKTDTMRNNL